MLSKQTCAAGALLLWGAFSYFASVINVNTIENSLASIYGHDQPQRKLDHTAETLTNSVSVRHHMIFLSGLQTLEMHEKMMSSCPVEHRLQTSRTMTFPEFVDNVFDGLEKVPVDQDPLYYVASQYSKLMEERGALGSGFWAEFGVYQGKTLKESHDLLKNTNFRGPMAGLDSFEGLPALWREGYAKGKYATDFEAVRSNVPEDVKLYRGWFQDSISAFLDDYPNTPAGLINHDGDLFLSTAITFSLAGERIVEGTLICCKCQKCVSESCTHALTQPLCNS
jgi:hypothetical protein